MERRKQLRLRPTDTLEVMVIGEGRTCMAGQIIDTSGRGLGLRVPAPLPDGTAIKIEADDTLLLGEVTGCVPLEGAFRVGLQIKHRLDGLGALHRLNRALHAEAEPVPARESPHNGGVKRVAVFGSQGQLGAELAATFSQRSFDVASFDRASVDISDAAAIEKAVSGFKPALVLNAAAYNKVDLAESDPESAFRVNSLAVRNLALACRAVSAKLVHYSTDYVFDGTSGQPYRESDATHPLSAYGVSKLAGEMYAQAYLGDALVIRTCGVFGPHGAHTPGGNFVETMLRLAKNGKPIKVVDDFVASPTYSPALAARTADLVERDASGIFHIGGGTPISFYDWAAKIFGAAGLQPDLKPTNEHDFPTPARRPKFSALSNEKMESLGIAPMPSLDDAITEYLSKTG